jgi:transcriptional regulator with XRE-family HTH domain
MISPVDIHYTKRLRGLRLSRDIMQKEAFELLGLKNQQEYSNLEGGHLHFTDEIISAICKSFEISPQEFTSGEPNIYFENSPYAHAQNSGNNHNNNDNAFIQDIIKAKDDALKAKEEIIKVQEEIIKTKDHLLKISDELLKEKEKLLKNQG